VPGYVVNHVRPLECGGPDALAVEDGSGPEGRRAKRTTVNFLRSVQTASG